MLTVSALVATTLGSPADYQAVDQEYDNRPDDRHGEAPEVEPYHIGPSCEPLKDDPPTKAPAIPSSMVTMQPPGSRPGMSSFAMTPATRPKITQDNIPSRSS